MRIAPLPLILAVLALGLTAAPAGAATADAIIKDCSNSPTGLLTGSYPKSDLRDARKLVRGDIAEYTGCMDAINAALNARSNDGGNGSNGSGNGSNPGSGGNTGSPGTSSGSPGSGLGTDSGSSGSDGSFGSTAGSSSDAPSTGGSGGGTTAPGTTPGAAPAATPPAAQQAGSGAPVRIGGETVTPGIPASFADDRRALPTPLIAFLVLLAAGAIGFGAPTIGRRVLARRRA